ncbi:hypothetical protein S2M10_01310 [Sphingomonas sp. S2M10]|uniref:hypothetical protein n=1 Tax=Sphingomonas sp. S2M10 TaxID=2705010 RepID=UPI0014573E35|nr:hypothetical protein [Sphingomonas sp. S2M10]NLS25168.1 hypothetical protein [Sphingomonas sp. S2M10]
MNGAPTSGPVQTKSAPKPRDVPSKGEPDTAPKQRKAFADALSRHAGKRAATDPGMDKAEGLAAMIAPRDFAALAVAARPAAAGAVDPAQHAQLDRIAAAIAEVSKTAQPEVHLSLPLGSYKVEGAVLGRDLAGQVNVLLLPSAAVPPAVAAQWSEQLHERLLRREVRVGKVGVQGSAAPSVAPR